MSGVTNSPHHAGDTASLQNIVLELANQVKSLQGLVVTSLEEKREVENQNQSLQQKYFSSL